MQTQMIGKHLHAVKQYLSHNVAYTSTASNGLQFWLFIDIIESSCLGDFKIWQTLDTRFRCKYIKFSLYWYTLELCGAAGQRWKHTS